MSVQYLFDEVSQKFIPVKPASVTLFTEYVLSRHIGEPPDLIYNSKAVHMFELSRNGPFDDLDTADSRQLLVYLQNVLTAEEWDQQKKNAGRQLHIKYSAPDSIYPGNPSISLEYGGILARALQHRFGTGWTTTQQHHLDPSQLRVQGAHPPPSLFLKTPFEIRVVADHCSSRSFYTPSPIHYYPVVNPSNEDIVNYWREKRNRLAARRASARPPLTRNGVVPFNNSNDNVRMTFEAFTELTQRRYSDDSTRLERSSGPILLPTQTASGGARGGRGGRGGSRGRVQKPGNPRASSLTSQSRLSVNARTANPFQSTMIGEGSVAAPSSVGNIPISSPGLSEFLTSWTLQTPTMAATDSSDPQSSLGAEVFKANEDSKDDVKTALQENFDEVESMQDVGSAEPVIKKEEAEWDNIS